jgi:A/G-specific adenine glycosylase
MAQNAAWAVPTALRSALLRWYDRAARDLPWRRTRDLYAIWVSEIMLQQTQVATVIPYWQRFLARFPDVSALAAADEHDVLKLWEGLGYYRRARQLHAAAKQISMLHNGQFPNSYEHVRTLPGIGRYTAGAILSIGLDQRLPILEANTIRVLSRLSAYQGDIKTSAAQKHLWSLAETLLPRRRCGAFNQALMELGSQICTPKGPQCHACPLAPWCAAHQQGLVSEIPVSSAGKDYEAVTEIAVIVRRGQKVYLRQCQPGERWAGLWDFPRFPLKVDRSGPERSAPRNNRPSRSTHLPSPELSRFIAAQTHSLTGLTIQPGDQLATLRHGVTRFRITLHCIEASLTGPAKSSAAEGGHAKWVTVHALSNYPLSSAGRKISHLLKNKI